MLTSFMHLGRSGRSLIDYGILEENLIIFTDVQQGVERHDISYCDIRQQTLQNFSGEINTFYSTKYRNVSELKIW